MAPAEAMHTKPGRRKPGRNGRALKDVESFYNQLAELAENLGVPPRELMSCLKRFVLKRKHFAAGEMLVLGAGLEPAHLSAHAPQTCVSAIPPPERGENG